MNPWLIQDLADQRRAQMVKAATQWRLTHPTGRATVRSTAGRWLITAGQHIAGPQGQPAANAGPLQPVIRLGS